MPINFITGLPRTGKTLWALCRVREIAEKDKRPVYYCNIPGVTIPGWQEIDHPDKWMECPDSSIIVIDELQDFWQKAGSGQKVPTPILELSKHGKRGIDFYIITQEPELVHQTPRLLCQHHYYIVRAFGSSNVMVYQFERIQIHPEKVKNKASHKFPWRYNKEAFNWYKSADVHNIKRKLPWQIWAIPVVLAIIPLLGYGIYWSFGAMTAKAKSVVPGASAPGAPPAPGQALPGLPGQNLPPGASPIPAPGAAPAQRVMTTYDYLKERAPRIEGIAHTAPVYDGLTAPSRVSYPAACIQSKKAGWGDCRCYTQDGTLYRTTVEICKNIVAHGIFLDFDPDPKHSAAADEAQKAAQQAARELVAEEARNRAQLKQQREAHEMRIAELSLPGARQGVASPAAAPAAPVSPPPQPFIGKLPAGARPVMPGASGG